MNALLHFYGRVTLVPPNFKLAANLVGVPNTPKRISQWEIPHDQVVEHSLNHGDIIRAKVNPEKGTCVVLDKILLE